MSDEENKRIKQMDKGERVIMERNSFDKFLKKNKFYVYEEWEPEARKNQRGKLVSVKYLGESMLNRFLKVSPLLDTHYWIRIVKNHDFPDDYNNGYWMLLEFAIGCLGEKEVIERLEKIQKTKWSFKKRFRTNRR